MTDDLFFDTDCLSAFLWINKTNILHELYLAKEVEVYGSAPWRKSWKSWQNISEQLFKIKKLKGWLFENNQGIQQFLEIYQASG